jgi:hypothetical protein
MNASASVSRDVSGAIASGRGYESPANFGESAGNDSGISTSARSTTSTSNPPCSRACSATQEATTGPNRPSRTLPTTMINFCFSLMPTTVRRRDDGNQTGRRLAPVGPGYEVQGRRCPP